MRPDIDARLESMYRTERQVGWDGEMHELRDKVRIPRPVGVTLADLHRSRRPALSAEIGFAYGFSTLFILDAMHEGGYGHHIAIDPLERERWRGIGLRAVNDLGLTERFEFIEDQSLFALCNLRQAGRRLDFLFIDGAHQFDYAFIDLCLGAQLTNVGGIIALDDLWLPSIQKVVAFARTNLPHLREIETGQPHIAVFEKVGEDTRTWDTFKDF